MPFRFLFIDSHYTCSYYLIDGRYVRTYAAVYDVDICTHFIIIHSLRESGKQDQTTI